MSYATQSVMSKDPDLWDRLASCAATQQVEDPFHWVSINQWVLCASPGWDDAYAYAITVGTERPGWQDTVITDAVILAGVQARIAYLKSVATPPVPAPE